ncbi:MAG: helix-turn-helix domain-containing protein [Actinobacteria bacterium]|nr:helix-turn-helix domain-containing protein [Actinomycetota bacterium]MBU1942448.1 helix-turn-helix domain-containing protein [Actinomycetota bacterium]MBU2686320.1 helix-turn-helix domain-containing protein [Actinomycetota bacterium]
MEEGALAADELLDTRQVAEFLHVSQATVRLWFRTGRLKAFKVGAQYRITVSELSNYLEENGWEGCTLALERSLSPGRGKTQSREYSREELDDMARLDELPEDLRRELDGVLGE